MKSSGANRGSMSQTRRKLCWPSAFVAAILAIVCAGCGGSSSTPSSSDNTLSAAQAQAVSGQVVQALTGALEDAFGVSLVEPRPSLATTMAGVHADSSSGCTTTSTGANCNFPVSYSGTCSGGGTITVTGDISGTLNSSDTGSIGAQMTVTPTNCAVSGTTFNGDPDITITGQIPFTNATPSYPITFTEGGGISYGPNPSGSCQVNVTYTITGASVSSCTVSGTVCGQSVNGSC